MRVDHTREPYLMIVFQEVEQEHRAGRRGAASQQKDTSSKRIVKLQQQLASTTEHLHTMIENQEATNEELQSANEEILSSNEELQSTNEELETAKEELQSTNEELTTVNDELRSRNHEVVQANNDLSNLLASIRVAVVIVGSDLTIRRFTQEAQKILGLIPSDVGRPLGNINSGLNLPNLGELVHHVIRDFTPLERDVHMASGKQYTLRALPYRTIDNNVDGAVITLVAESIREAKLAGEAFLVDHPSDLMAVLDSDLRVKAATLSFCQAVHVNAEKVQNLPLSRLNHILSDNPELQKALQKAQRDSEAVAPFAVELRLDGEGRRKFECRLDRIILDGGAKVITLSLHAGPTAEKSAQTIA